MSALSATVSELHTRLSDFRVSKDREFFRYPLHLGIKLLEELQGRHGRPTVDDFSAIDITGHLRAKHPGWIRDDLTSIRLAQTSERVYLETTEDELIGGYLKTQTIRRQDLAFIVDGDESSRIITCYEGDDATALDVGIIQQARISTPTTPHMSLTEDDDQLTSRWTAGDYRRVTTMLANYAASKENTIHVDPDFLRQIGKPEISVPQPTVVWLVRPSMAPDCHVFDHLVLPTVIDSKLKWKLVSLLETPIVMVGERYCALSSDLKTLSTIDDYMLRLAARVDERQYSLANGLREERMIKICGRALQRCPRPWTVNERIRYTKPPQEADILATRDAETLVLELKSTLRPETPWEVHKRNEDIIVGVKQARSLIDRGAAGHGFVVTDGYRGDYTCWAEAITCDIPIATLYDLEVIANDPGAAIFDVKSRVGILGSITGTPERLPDRETDLLDWKLRIVDRDAPEETRR